MDLQSQAFKTTELIAQRLDPLCKSFNIQVKIRESDPSIFAEYLRYENDRFAFQITACLHPHDYPFSLTLQLIDKSYSPWKYIHQPELFDIVQKQCEIGKSDLLIATDDQLQTTLDELTEIMKCFLRKTFNIK